MYPLPHPPAAPDGRSGCWSGMEYRYGLLLYVRFKQVPYVSASASDGSVFARLH